MMQKKPVLIVLAVTAFILLIPLIAMQFTDQVNWSLSDFVIAAVILAGTGLMAVTLIPRIKQTSFRTMAYVMLVLVFILIWAELAVGIFGSPLAGS